MSVHGKVQVLNPEKVELEITIRAPVEEWREIMRVMGSKWPDWKFGATIADAIGKTVGRIDSFHDVGT